MVEGSLTMLPKPVIHRPKSLSTLEPKACVPSKPKAILGQRLLLEGQRPMYPQAKGPFFHCLRLQSMRAEGLPVKPRQKLAKG